MGTNTQSKVGRRKIITFEVEAIRKHIKCVKTVKIGGEIYGVMYY